MKCRPSSDAALVRWARHGLVVSCLFGLVGSVWAQQPPTPAATPTNTASAGTPTDDGAPDDDGKDSGWMERWLYNPKERTEKALEAHRQGRSAGAAEALQSAMRLRDGDPLSRYNAGTVHLKSGQDQALPLLQGAASDATQELSADAHYNLGNAQLAGQDFPSAIESYKSALRREPGMDAAKFNLELAQKLLQEQQQDQQDQDQQDQDQQDQDQQNQDQQNQDQQNQDQQDQDQQDQDQQNQDQQDQDQQDQDQQDQDQQNQDQQDQDQQDQDQQNQDQQDQDQQNQDQQDQDQQDQDPQNQDPQNPLPQFKDLPDMSAEEAAAMLEAIENLEREQRRQEALEAARAQSGRKKDW